MGIDADAKRACASRRAVPYRSPECALETVQCIVSDRVHHLLMEMGVGFAGLDAALYCDEGIIEIHGVVKAISAAIVVDYANALPKGSGIKFLVLDHECDHISRRFASARIESINFQRSNGRGLLSRLNAGRWDCWRIAK